MVPGQYEQTSKAKCLAYQQDFCACDCVRPPNPLEQKAAYGVFRGRQRGHNGVHAKRPPVVPASGLVDPNAWLSCAGSGELAPEVGRVKGTARIKPPKDFFRWVRVDFRKTWHL